MLVFAGSETKRKPFRAGVGGHVLAGVGGVVAVTAIVAVFSRKSPRNPSAQSFTDLLFVVPLHFIRSELMTELTWPSGWKVLSEFGTVKASKTSAFFTVSVATSSSRSNWTL